jgi:3-isopropylmalate dehydrogenase
LKANLVLLPGDGIGPEVVAEAVRVLGAVAKRFGHEFAFAERLMGGCSLAKFGRKLHDAVQTACVPSDALLGAVGGLKWDARPPGCG